MFSFRFIAAAAALCLATAAAASPLVQLPDGRILILNGRDYEDVCHGDSLCIIYHQAAHAAQAAEARSLMRRAPELTKEEWESMCHANPVCWWAYHDAGIQPAGFDKRQASLLALALGI